MRVNLRRRSGDRAGRASLSESAGSSATHPPLGPMLLPLATVLGLTGCSYVLGPAVRRLPDTPYLRGRRYYQKSCVSSVSDATLS